MLQGVLQEGVGGVGQEGLIPNGRCVNPLPLIAMAICAKRAVGLGASDGVPLHRIPGQLQGLNAFDLKEPAGEQVDVFPSERPAHFFAVGRHRRALTAVANGRKQMGRKARAQKLRAF